MATYYLAVAFGTDPSTDPKTDGTHYDAQYGFGVDSGNGTITPVDSSGSTGRQFEAVHVPAATGNSPNQLVLALFSNILGINQSASYVRGAFRPAHDVGPSNNLATSPLNTSDTQTFLNGLLLSNRASSPVNVNNGTKYGLPEDFFSTMWTFAPFQLNQGGQRNTSVHFELTIEITTYDANNNPTYFKLDPEMMIDY